MSAKFSRYTSFTIELYSSPLPVAGSLKFKIYTKVIASKSKMMWKSETSISFMIFSRNINLNNKINGLYLKALSVRITGLIFSLSAK